MGSKAQEKASRYISSLYEARCNERWQDVPELARKVEKHAPSRGCLTLAARAGALVHARPLQEIYREAEERYGEVLLGATRETTHAGDVLDTSTTHATIYYGMHAPDPALKQVAEPLHRSQAPVGGTGSEAWHVVCVLQGTLIRGLSYEALRDDIGATTTYRSIISYLSNVVALKEPCPALRRATEELTTHVCLYFSTTTEQRPASMGEAMAAYHVLSRLLQSQGGKFAATRGVFTKNTPRQFWRVYYTALSQVVKDGLVYHPSPLDRDHEALEHKGLLDDADFTAARKRQRAELQRVEQNYESVLLQETKFPKANEVNEEVKTWVEMVINNWRVLCGHAWTDDELGDAGKSAVGRNTLDILYRAQTKTFHSTQILRHLVAVHAYLADFDLAMKAFDTYVEILTKGKARVKKTGTAGLDLDDDNIAIKLAADVVRLACRYGSGEAAEKALHIGAMIQKWLERGVPDTAIVSAPPTVNNIGSEGELSAHASFSEDALERAYRSVGISQGAYSRYTYDPNIRKVLQQSSVRNLRTSLRYKPADADASDTLFALSMILAEMRDSDQALGIARHDLGMANTLDVNAVTASNAVPMFQPRKNTTPLTVGNVGMMPMRHLHALLLAAADDYDGSLAACNIALERVIGVEDGSEHDAVSTNAPSRMSNYDKQNAVELKLTQIALIQIIGNAEKAVNASNELICLYVQLFGPIRVRKRHHATQEPQLPPKSSSGTMKSIFGRDRRSRRMFSGIPSTAGSTSPSATQSTLPSRPATMTRAPAINVIEESAGETNYESFHTASTNGDATNGGGVVFDEKQSTPKRDGSLRKKAMGSLRSNKGSQRPTSKAKMDTEKVLTAGGMTAPAVSQRDLAGHQAGGKQPLDPVPHNFPHNKLAPPAKHDEQPPKQDTRLPVPPPGADSYGPLPVFLQLQQSKFSMSLLVKVWLFIAKLYIDSDLLAEASEAVNEAYDLVTALELEVSQAESSLRAFQDRGWGGGKSVEDLWADVCAAKGELYHSQGRPHDALHVFEQALNHSMNHPAAIVGLGTILLDIYTQKISSEKPDPNALTLPHPPAPSTLPTPATKQSTFTAETLALYRLAARDRAYALLSSLVKTYDGHALSEAWLVLARAYELSNQLDEAREALWKAVELEDTAGVRAWGDVFRVGGFVLR